MNNAQFSDKELLERINELYRKLGSMIKLNNEQLDTIMNELDVLEAEAFERGLIEQADL